MNSLLVSWLTWLVLALFYAYQFIERIIPNIIMEEIMKKYSIDANGIGHFAGIYYVGYILMHIPLGIILEHFSAKKVIPFCILFCVLGFIPLVYMSSFTAALYGRLLIGLGSVGALIGAFKLLSLCFGEEKFPKMLGWMVTFGLLGAVFGNGPITTLISYLGWIKTLNYIVILGIALAIFSYFVIPDTKSEQEFRFSVIVDDFKYLFSNKIVLLISCLGGLMIGPLEGFADAWSNQYLKSVYHFTNQEASNITQLVYIGMVVGLVVIGYVFEKTKSYYGLLIISAISMLSCFILLLNQLGTEICIHSPVQLLETFSICVIDVLFFIIGFFCSYQILVIAKSISIVFVHHRTFISAVSNMIMMIFGYFFHRFIGKLLHYFWDGNVNVNGVPIYTADNFYSTLIILPVTLTIATIGYGILAYVEKGGKKIA